MILGASAAAAAFEMLQGLLWAGCWGFPLLQHDCLCLTPAAASAAAVEAPFDELLERVSREELGDEVPRLPDGVEDADRRRDEQEDEGQHNVEAEVAQTAPTTAVLRG